MLVQVSEAGLWFKCWFRSLRLVVQVVVQVSETGLWFKCWFRSLRLVVQVSETGGSIVKLK